MSEAVARIDLFHRQTTFVRDMARYPAAIGGIGSGKTFVGAAKVVSRLNRRELGLVCAPTFPMLRDATQRTLFSMMRDLGVRFDYNKGEKLLTVPGSGHEILFRSLDDPDNMRGPNVSYAWVDEAAYVSDVAWRVIKGRTRVGDMQQAWITTTPKGRNWIWEEWVHHADDRHTMYRFRTDENPTLDPEYLAGLGYEGKFAAQELGGDFVSFDGLVYEAFDRERNVQVVDCDGWRTVLGVDVGARNPTVVLVLRVAGDGRVHVEREYYQRGMSASDITAMIEDACDENPPEAVYIDPSAAAYISDLAGDGYPVEKAVNDVQTGIQRVASAFGVGLTVDPSCVHTIAEFESYQYPDERRANSDNPIKQNDHCMDALRYGCMGALEPVLDLADFYRSQTARAA